MYLGQGEGQFQGRRLANASEVCVCDEGRIVVVVVVVLGLHSCSHEPRATNHHLVVTATASLRY